MGLLFLFLGIDDYVVERMYNSLNDGFQVQSLQCFYNHGTGRLLFDHVTMPLISVSVCVASNKQRPRILEDYPGH